MPTDPVLTASVESLNAKLSAIANANAVSPAVLVLILEAIKSEADALYPNFKPYIDAVIGLVEKAVGGN